MYINEYDFQRFLVKYEQYPTKLYLHLTVGATSTDRDRFHRSKVKVEVKVEGM